MARVVIYYADFLSCTIQSNVVLNTDRHQIPGGMIVKVAFASHMVCDMLKMEGVPVCTSCAGAIIDHLHTNAVASVVGLHTCCGCYASICLACLMKVRFQQLL